MSMNDNSAGPQPGDLDQYGNPIEEQPHFDPFAHFALDEDDWQLPPDSELDDRDPDDRIEGNVHELDLGNLLETIDPAEWDDHTAPEREWTLDTWIPARQMTYLTGAGSAGKSLLGQQLSTCVAMGKPFLGVKTVMANSLYLTCEDDYDELHRRQKKICAGTNTTLTYLSGKMHIMSLMGAIGNELATFDEAGRMKTSEAFKRLLCTIRAYKIGFVVLDNVAHLFTGNENIRNQVAAFCGLLNKLASETQCAVLLIGHPNKAGDAYSGSTAWENQVRSRLFMEVPKDEDGNIPDMDARILRRAKANYAQNGETIDFRWHEMCFKTDSDMPADEFADHATSQREAFDERAFMACLEETTRQNRAVSEQPGRNYAPNIFAEMKASQRMGKTRLKRAMNRLFDAGKLERGEVARGKDRHPVIGIRPVSGVRETAGNPPPFAGNSLGTALRETVRETRGERGKPPRDSARETAGLSTPISLQDITERGAPSGVARPAQNLMGEPLDFSTPANPANLPADKLRAERDPWDDEPDAPF